MPSSYNADDEPPKKYTTHPPPPPPPSLSSLPDEIVSKCLALVPRSYHLSLSWVSKNLKALVRSLPELSLLQSTTRHKNSLHLCLEEKEDDEDDDEEYSSFHWFTLNETSTEDYRLVLNPTPFPLHDYDSSSTAVAVGSKIFFVGGSTEPSSDLWILDTRSGEITQGPSMRVPREQFDAAVVGVVDGEKIYVLGGGGRPEESFHEEIQVEVFDIKSETWELSGVENLRKTRRCSASVEGKVYMVEYEEVNVYDPREEGMMVKMVSERLAERGGRKDVLNDTVDCVCVVDGVLYAFVRWNGVLWFDTKRDVWRRLVGRDGKGLHCFTLHEAAMAEHDGRLVVLWGENGVDNANVQCVLVSLDRCGGRICGTVDWFGIAASIPYSLRFLHCLAVSD